MRTALLSTLEPSSDGSPRAFLQLGGRSVLEWQIDIALDNGCQRIVCLTERPWPQLEPIRQRIERKGLEFQEIGGPMHLVGLVSADQEILAIGDGIIMERALANEALRRGRMVAAVPAEDAISAGFERIDGDNAWGGLILARAQIVERLAEMPADSDTISLLIRLALQAGTPLVQLGETVIENGELLLAQDIGSLQGREHALLDRSARSISWLGPGRALAQKLARRLAPQGLDRGPLLAALIGAVLVAGGLALAVYGTIAAAFLLMGLAGFSASLSRALRELRASLLGLSSGQRFTPIFRWVFDISLILVAAWPITTDTVLERLFVPTVLIVSFRLAEMTTTTKLAPMWRDRVLLAVIMAGATIFAILPQTMSILVLIALGACLLSREPGKQN